MYKWKFFGVIALLIVFFYVILSGRNDVKELRSSGIITNAVITDLKSIFKQGIHLNYYFYANGRRFYSKTKILWPYCEENLRHLVGIKIPVIYSKNRPSSNVLLLETEVYRNYNFKYPDSLKRVVDSLNIFECK